MRSNKRKRMLNRCPCCPYSNRRFDEHGLFQHALATYENNPNCAASRAHLRLIGQLADNISADFKFQGRIFNPAIKATGDIAVPVKLEGITRVHPTFEGNGGVSQLTKPISENTEFPQHIKQENKSNCHPETTAESLQLQASGKEKNDDDAQVVWPWIGVLVNVHSSIVSHNSKLGSSDDVAYNANIIKQISCLNPKNVHTHFSKSPYGGMALLEFGTDVIGYFDAHNFKRKYFQLGRGRENWQHVFSERKDPGKEPYGWIADETDYIGNNQIGECLRKIGQLRPLHEVKYLDSSFEQLYQDMSLKLQEKNMKLMEYVTENSKLQMTYYQVENSKYKAKARAVPLEKMHLKEMEITKKIQTEMSDAKIICHDLEEKYKEQLDNQQEIEGILEEKERLQDCYQQVLYKERALNDEIQDAKRKAVKILEKLDGGGHGIIGIKTIGEIDKKPWEKVCSEKFKYHDEGWQTSFTELFSLWESYVLDGSWYPFKTVSTGPNKIEECVDESDGKIVELREELGNDVCMTVVSALNELQQYNASGRYKIRIPWNFQQEREATMEEIVIHVSNCSNPRKRSRNTASSSGNQTYAHPG